MKRFLHWLFICLCFPATAGQIANVQYIHNMINNYWDITLPYNSELTNPTVVANMQYLLTSVDVANAILNGQQTTNWGTSEYATTQVADTIAVDTVVQGLISIQQTPPDSPDDNYEDGITTSEYPFAIGLADGTDEFTFLLSVQGSFVVDWGDGTIENINKTDTSEQVMFHRYDTPGAYIIRLGGVATAYDTAYYPSYWIPAVPSIAVSDYWSVERLYGRLGRLFPTLADGTQPRFAGAFMYCELLTEIPSVLFDGISGQPGDYMFYSMFEGSYSLTQIPDDLFDGLSGDLGQGTFNYMFASCSDLSGDSAKIDGRYLYQVWPNATAEQVGGMYSDTGGLSDYGNIPSAWK